MTIFFILPDYHDQLQNLTQQKSKGKYIFVVREWVHCIWIFLLFFFNIFCLLDLWQTCDSNFWLYYFLAFGFVRLDLWYRLCHCLCCFGHLITHMDMILVTKPPLILKIFKKYLIWTFFVIILESSVMNEITWDWKLNNLLQFW